MFFFMVLHCLWKQSLGKSLLFCDLNIKQIGRTGMGPPTNLFQNIEFTINSVGSVVKLTAYVQDPSVARRGQLPSSPQVLPSMQMWID